MARKSRCKSMKVVIHNVPAAGEVIDAIQHGQQTMIRLIAEAAVRDIKEKYAKERARAVS